MSDKAWMLFYLGMNCALFLLNLRYTLKLLDLYQRIEIRELESDEDEAYADEVIKQLDHGRRQLNPGDGSPFNVS